MPNVNVAEVVVDPEFAQEFFLERTYGSYINGRFTTSSVETLARFGVILPLTTRDLQMVPEGDQIGGGVKVYTIEPIQVSEFSANSKFSDRIIWHGEKYKILSVSEYSDFGYFEATAVRMRGA